MTQEIYYNLAKPDLRVSQFYDDPEDSRNIIQTYGDLADVLMSGYHVHAIIKDKHAKGPRIWEVTASEINELYLVLDTHYLLGSGILKQLVTHPTVSDEKYSFLKKVPLIRLVEDSTPNLAVYTAPKDWWKKKFMVGASIINSAYEYETNETFLWEDKDIFLNQMVLLNGEVAFRKPVIKSLYNADIEDIDIDLLGTYSIVDDHINNQIQQAQEDAIIINKVNSPNHYIGEHGLEVESVLANFMPRYKDSYIGHRVASALEYLLRAPQKNKLEDVKKAKKNIEQLIEYIEEYDIQL